MVDIFYDDVGNIVKLRLPADPDYLIDPRYRRVPMRVTPEYLDADEILLPRLLPLAGF